MKKKNFKLKTLKFFILCSSPLQKPVFQVSASALAPTTSPRSTEVLICGTYVLPQLCLFWETFWTELADKKSYKASIGGKRLRLVEL